jgi:hypothetical protein
MYTTITWQDRSVEFPNRFTKAGETSSSVTLTASPGTVTQTGTPISSSNMNRMEQGVFDAQLLAYMGGF